MTFWEINDGVFVSPKYVDVIFLRLFGERVRWVFNLRNGTEPSSSFDTEDEARDWLLNLIESTP